MLIANADIARTRPELDETGALVYDFMGLRKVTGEEPSAYLVELPPDFKIEPHFHGANQYQVLIAGDATIGRRPMQAGSFHYADSYTTYGPILAGQTGVAYFTLRQHGYGEFHRMPGSRDQLQPSARRTFIGYADPRGTGAPALRELANLGDGTGAYQMTKGPRQVLALPAVRHGGAHLIVQSGSLLVDTDEVPEQSCIWINHDEPMPVLLAGEEGAVLLFTSYPYGAAVGRDASA